ncbi:hypothetical protein BDK51DRAFT_38140 [Blyttiomyces helicus]|uniref:Uncharacterized protein n=1 Tax=Blyttiomyces helicus TaxID=388810 RepID=A0A4P9WAI8_9FUNG|nr:hypothetical protein BDK51DRAFT_38140 [Blyttiomyces helicus]|eukprot:RKO89232.1 hypothetical protein BDK51DRAFT_38140 [Blyttiomyces helicus]
MPPTTIVDVEAGGGLFDLSPPPTPIPAGSFSGRVVRVSANTHARQPSPLAPQPPPGAPGARPRAKCLQKSRNPDEMIRMRRVVSLSPRVATAGEGRGGEGRAFGAEKDQQRRRQPLTSKTPPPVSDIDLPLLCCPAARDQTILKHKQTPCTEQLNSLRAPRLLSQYPTTTDPVLNPQQPPSPQPTTTQPPQKKPHPQSLNPTWWKDLSARRDKPVQKDEEEKKQDEDVVIKPAAVQKLVPVMLVPENKAEIPTAKRTPSVSLRWLSWRRRADQKATQTPQPSTPQPQPSFVPPPAEPVLHTPRVPQFDSGNYQLPMLYPAATVKRTSPSRRVKPRPASWAPTNGMLVDRGEVESTTVGEKSRSNEIKTQPPTEKKQDPRKQLRKSASMFIPAIAWDHYSTDAPIKVPPPLPVKETPIKETRKQLRRSASVSITALVRDHNSGDAPIKIARPRPTSWVLPTPAPVIEGGSNSDSDDSTPLGLSAALRGRGRPLRLRRVDGARFPNPDPDLPSSGSRLRNPRPASWAPLTVRFDDASSGSDSTAPPLSPPGTMSSISLEGSNESADSADSVRRQPRPASWTPLTVRFDENPPSPRMARRNAPGASRSPSLTQKEFRGIMDAKEVSIVGRWRGLYLRDEVRAAYRDYRLSQPPATSHPQSPDAYPSAPYRPTRSPSLRRISSAPTLPTLEETPTDFHHPPPIQYQLPPPKNPLLPLALLAHRVAPPVVAHPPGPGDSPRPAPLSARPAPRIDTPPGSGAVHAGEEVQGGGPG